MLVSEKDPHRATPGPSEGVTFSGIAPTKKHFKKPASQVSFKEISELMVQNPPTRDIIDLSQTKPNPYQQPSP
jgi:hypothetical protein